MVKVERSSKRWVEMGRKSGGRETEVEMDKGRDRKVEVER